ncbi:MAG: alpha/beta fold hydrolase [Gemmataceae bacterium]|nr:alpha/beta fold hydrolase [Gemmataceae bacterium]
MLLTFLVAGALLLLVVNRLAWKQAGAMVFIAASGERTSRIKKLSRWRKILVLLKGINLPRNENESAPGDFGLEFKVVRFPGLQGRLEGWFIPCPGASQVVLLFHGYARNKSTLLIEALLFHRMGCACLMVDFPGAGGSQGRQVTLGFYEAVDVMQAATWTRLHHPQLRQVLFGHSMGAVAILTAATRYDLPVAGFILESPFASLLETVEARFRAMGIPPFPLTHLLLFWGSLRLRLNGYTHRPIDYAKLVTMPVLQLHGSNDARVPLARAKALFHNLLGSKTFVEFHQSEHEPLAAKEPLVWERAVRGFLQSLDEKKSLAA